jgi:preprotein translocase subunit SecE
MSILKSFEEAKDELSKVIFPLKEQVKSAFISVFVVVTVITLFLSLVDMTMSFTVSSIME